MQNYQKRTKRITVFVILMMLFSFLVNPVMTVVDALTTNLAIEKVTELTTKLNNIDQKIQDAKNGVDYNSDKALQQAITEVEKEVSTLKSNLNNEVTNLETSISVATLIINSGNTTLNDKLTEYLSLSNTLPTYNIDNLEDIKYDKEGIEQTLITKDEIANLVVNEYLTDDDTAISNYVTNFDVNVNNYVSKYNTFETEIDDTISLADTTKTTIESYISNEKLLGNTPNEIVDNENIITLLDDIKNELGTLKNNIDLSKFLEQETKLNELKNKITNCETKFYENNYTYIELGLDTEIGVLETYYDNINQNIATWFNINGLTEDYSLVTDKLDTVLIDFLKEAIVLDEDYIALNEKITNYLSRKISDKDAIDTLVVDLNNLYNKLNKDSVLSNIDTIVNNTDLSVEANVDLLYQFLSIEDLSDETRKKIETAKLSFYTLGLLDETNYTWEILEDEIIIKGLKSSLLFIDLSSNINFTGIFGLGDSIMKDYISGTSYIDLYDNNYNFIKTYKFIIQGDIDNNGLFEENDITELTKLTLASVVKEKDLLLGNLDNDDKITIKDVILLEEIININQAPSTTEYATKSNIKITRVEDGNKIHYDILLEADGIVQGLQFNIGSTSDLTFAGFESDYNILLDDLTKPTKVIGKEEFAPGHILRLTYEKSENPLDQTSFIASDIILVNTSAKIDEIERIINTIVNQKEEVTTNNNVVQTTNNIIEETTPVEEEKQPELEISDIEVVEPEEEQIAWGNVIKIVIIVLLGALIIYFLNKKEETSEEEQTKKDETK